MFKLHFTRDGVEKREESVIGHDRFCQQKHFSLPRYKRRRNNRRTQEETDLAFELVRTPADSSNGTYASTSAPSCTKGFYQNGSDLPYSTSKQSSTTQLRTPEDSVIFNKGSSIHQISKYREARTIIENDESQHPKTSWEIIGKYFSTIAATLTCRDSSTKNAAVKYNTKTCEYNSVETPEEASDSTTLEDESRGYYCSSSETGRFSPYHKILQTEKKQAHAIAMSFLESFRSNRYVLIDNLPRIGWRSNRLWYLICDTHFNVERLLTVTANATKCLFDSASTSELKKLTQSFQHPYMSPILDLEVFRDEDLGKIFVVTITPVASSGSLRDNYQKSRWTDHWRSKYAQRGSGLPEVQVQRFSCHILEALLGMTMRGLPAGSMGIHLHAGNVIIQHGIARFSALENILFAHTPSNKLLVKVSQDASNPDIDTIAFAHMLFSMCYGCDLSTITLTGTNWDDIRDYPQVSEVLQNIFGNSDCLPSLQDIAQLEFFRSIDLRELRAFPAPEVLSGPPLTALNSFIEKMEMRKLQKGRKSRSTVGMHGFINNGWIEQRASIETCHSTSTPSIHRACEDDFRLEQNRNGSTSSQMSLYWTPPSSLGFITK